MPNIPEGNVRTYWQFSLSRMTATFFVSLLQCFSLSTKNKCYTLSETNITKGTAGSWTSCLVNPKNNIADTSHRKCTLRPSYFARQQIEAHLLSAFLRPGWNQAQNPSCWTHLEFPNDLNITQWGCMFRGQRVCYMWHILALLDLWSRIQC